MTDLPKRARNPELLGLTDPPTIYGFRCMDCNRVAFPPDPYGCEKCGATPDRFETAALAPTGRIHSLATVHRHHHPSPETPFTVATITLDDGPTLKAVLVGSDKPTVGASVVGCLEPWDVDEDGIEIVDLRFRLSTPEGA